MLDAHNGQVGSERHRGCATGGGRGGGCRYMCGDQGQSGSACVGDGEGALASIRWAGAERMECRRRYRCCGYMCVQKMARWQDGKMATNVVGGLCTGNGRLVAVAVCVSMRELQGHRGGSGSLCIKAGPVRKLRGQGWAGATAHTEGATWTPATWPSTPARCPRPKQALTGPHKPSQALPETPRHCTSWPVYGLLTAY